MHLKLRRPGHEWLVDIEHVKFVETMLLTAFNALAPEPRRGVLRVDERLPAVARAELVSALPTRGGGAPSRPERSGQQLPPHYDRDSPQNEACRSPNGWHSKHWECSARTRQTALRGSRHCSFR